MGCLCGFCSAFVDALQGYEGVVVVRCVELFVVDYGDLLVGFGGNAVGFGYGPAGWIGVYVGAICAVGQVEQRSDGASEMGAFCYTLDRL